MSAELPATEENALSPAQNAAAPPPRAGTSSHAEEDEADEADEGEDSDEDQDDEPKLKYAKLTGSLTSVYRNGDSTSSFLAAGDKMVLGTHNGNIHVLSLPSLKSLRTYHAHSATITSLSISPLPPPPSQGSKSGPAAAAAPATPTMRANASVNSTTTTPSPRTQQRQQQHLAIPNTSNNQIYIATSSLDGHVCISSLLDPKDVQLRNFARPVQAVALSPDYKTDRTSLSGGLAGSLILTVGGKAGVTTDANTNSSAAAATSGFLGALGLGGGGDKGKDTVLHSGEGAISTIRWSLSGKWVVWVNEEGIKIMRSHIRLDSESLEDAWRRIAHAARPNRRGWEEMVGVWRGRAEWVDERRIEIDDDEGAPETKEDGVKKEGVVNGINGSPEVAKRPKSGSRKSTSEKLLVGWGDTAWILHVTEGGSTPADKKQVGSADIIHKLQFRDCIVSGLMLYTPSLLAILAYRTRDDNDKPIQQQTPAANDTPTKKGRHHRQTGLAPQLRLVNVRTGEEDEIDELSISRFETLSAQDYHLGSVFIPAQSKEGATTAAAEKGALEGLWEGSKSATRNATRMFSSSVSVRSADSNSLTSPGSSALGVSAAVPPITKRIADAHPFLSGPGLKLFVQSPYDCVLAVKRDLKDHLEYLLKGQDFAQAWALLDKHPEVVGDSTSAEQALSSQPSTPSRPTQEGGSLAEFFADDTSSQHSGKEVNAQKEKRHVGELWLQQLVSSSRWAESGKVAGKVLGVSRRWEHWVLTFAQAGKFDEITSFIPSEAVLPSIVYEVVLGHYVASDRQRLKELLELWEPERELYDVGSVRAAVESELSSGELGEDSEDWRILMEALAKLDLADGRAQEALRCYIRVQNAEKAMQLLREENLMDVIAAEDVPGLLMLRVSKEQMRSAPLNELEEASAEAVQLLVQEALRGTLMPATIIRQLERKGRSYRPFLFFYLRALWRGADEERKLQVMPRAMFDPRVGEGHALVEDHADLAVELFAEYDRKLLMDFLRASEVYSYEKAATICEQRHYVPELVYVLSKTGQTKRALFLIIGELGDVGKAIDFAKENPDLWDDLLDYSMDKPSFIKGLLEEVGTAIDPIQLVKRIPEGLEIEGLRDGIARMMREYDIQFSLSEGVARVLRGEVVTGMDMLRAGQRKGVRFEVLHEAPKEVELSVVDPPAKPAEVEALPLPDRKVERDEAKTVRPGYCVGCGEVFSEDEKEILIGFACGHVYHLSCLLKSNPDTSDPATLSRLQSQLGGSTDEGYGYASRSVGAKVAHAHIIKNVISGGCRHCIVPDGA